MNFGVDSSGHTFPIYALHQMCIHRIGILKIICIDRPYIFVVMSFTDLMHVKSDTHTATCIVAQTSGLFCVSVCSYCIWINT